MTDKTAVSISEMARMVGLSRQRFHQLIVAGVFPLPLYDITTRRPFYNEDMQQVCLEVRRRNCGQNGKPILFYARRVDHRPATVRTTKPKGPRQRQDRYADLIDGLKSLGMSGVTASQVDAAIKEALPRGVEGMAPAEVLRAVFLHLQRKEHNR